MSGRNATRVPAAPHKLGDPDHDSDSDSGANATRICRHLHGLAGR